MSDDRRWMGLALGLAARGLGRVWPNPAVGCVILRDGRVLGRGWTQPGGRPHAETMALAGIDARGATAFVSLEPCAHHGRTPPCTDSLIDAGIARVVTAQEDPDPRVSGRGHAALRKAGIRVETGVMAAEAEALQHGFLRRVRSGLPGITLKLATTLDGKIATAQGESKWITGAEARVRVQLMRAAHDAVMVGSGTVLADDPLLTVRALGLLSRPVRVVVDTMLQTPLNGKLAKMDAPVWLLHGPGVSAKARAAWLDKGAEVIECPINSRGIDLRAGMRALADRGLTRVLCEGGAGLAASLLKEDLADRLAIFQAGKFIGAEGMPGVGQLGLEALSRSPAFSLTAIERIGPDTLSLWRSKIPEAPAAD